MHILFRAERALFNLPGKQADRHELRLPHRDLRRQHEHTLSGLQLSVRDLRHDCQQLPGLQGGQGHRDERLGCAKLHLPRRTRFLFIEGVLRQWGEHKLRGLQLAVRDVHNLAVELPLLPGQQRHGNRGPRPRHLQLQDRHLRRRVVDELHHLLRQLPLLHLGELLPILRSGVQPAQLRVSAGCACVGHVGPVRHLRADVHLDSVHGRPHANLGVVLQFYSDEYRRRAKFAFAGELFGLFPGY